jgi:hypothetical protein
MQKPGPMLGRWCLTATVMEAYRHYYPAFQHTFALQAKGESPDLGFV